LNRNEAGGLITDLSTPDDSQAKSVAQIIQLIRPDLLLLNEFDYDNQGSSSSGSLAAELFQQNYLGVSQAADADSIVYPYVYAVPSNTGIPSNVDLDNNNSTTDANDAFGFGFFPGQYAFCVFSMYPIMEESIRTFQTFKWVDMPDALLPVNPDGSSYYSTEALDVFRLSSKNHADVPINAQNKTIHFLVSHPTPPVFDGEEDRNGRRNYDEIRFWKDYVNGASYMYDDDGVMGGLSADSLFVVAGDLNSDPFDGDSVPGAAQLLLEDPLIDTSLTPSSNGGIAAAESQAGDNLNHQARATQLLTRLISALMG
jgi:3-phytase/alkaline phosphatase D